VSKVYETCRCSSCPRGEFQDGLGKTVCKSCEDVLPGSNTTSPGTTGPELCMCLASNDRFLSQKGDKCEMCADVRSGAKASPLGSCPCPYDTYEVAANQTVEEGDLPLMTCRACPASSSTLTYVESIGSNGRLRRSREHEYGISIGNCYCLPGSYLTAGEVRSCVSMPPSEFEVPTLSLRPRLHDSISPRPTVACLSSPAFTSPGAGTDPCDHKERSRGPSPVARVC
jgi:hypothetical protein